jgi:hypothetical protein
MTVRKKGKGKSEKAAKQKKQGSINKEDGKGQNDKKSTKQSNKEGDDLQRFVHTLSGICMFDKAGQIWTCYL